MFIFHLIALDRRNKRRKSDYMMFIYLLRLVTAPRRAGVMFYALMQLLRVFNYCWMGMDASHISFWQTMLLFWC